MAKYTGNPDLDGEINRYISGLILWETGLNKIPLWLILSIHIDALRKLEAGKKPTSLYYKCWRGMA